MCVRRITDDTDRGPAGEPAAAEQSAPEDLEVQAYSLSTPHRPPRARRQGRVDAPAGLEAGFLIGADHVLVTGQRLAVSDPLVQAEHAGGLETEVRVAGKDPRPVPPGPEHVSGQPAAHR